MKIPTSIVMKPSDVESEPLTRESFELDSLEEPAELQLLGSTLSNDEPKDSSLKSKWQRIFSPGVQLYLVALTFGIMMRAVSKYVVETVDPLIAVQMRMVIMGTCALSYLYGRRIPYTFYGSPEVRKLVLLRGILGCVNITLMFFALQFISLPDLTFLGFLGPVSTGILSRIILHESYVWQQMVCGLVSLVGVAVIAKPAFLFPTKHISDSDVVARSIDPAKRSLAIFGAVLVVLIASFVMIVTRKIGKRAHPLTTVGMLSVATVVGNSIALLVKFLAGGTVKYPSDLKSWALIASTGLLGFGLQSLSSKALQLEQASILAACRPTQLIWAILLEALVWGDLPDIWSVLGGAIILVSVTYSASFKKDQPET